MIYFLVNILKPWLQEHGLYGPFNVFTYPEFRAVLAIVLAFFIVLCFGKRTIRWLLTQKIGDNPEFYHKDLNQIMKNKANTPTMGGLLIMTAILVTTILVADVVGNYYIHMGILGLVWLAIMGGYDDRLKLLSSRRRPGTREGLYTWEKLVLQVGLAALLGIFIYHHGWYKHTIDVDDIRRMSHALVLPFVKTWQYNPAVEGFVPANLIELPRWLFVILAIFVITGSSNAVNLTDGMDGLASGIMAIVAFAFMLLCLIAGDERLAKQLLVPWIDKSDELAILSGAMCGACLGFLWFNCSPAMVFMGDTGSLALGGLIGFIAIVIRQEVLLLLIGGVFVFEAVSVILQVGYFKFSGGKRIFRCAPVHHHFHLGGWTEQQVVIRFWLITAVLAACALATIKLR
jgi:phospho-N-acetylmuramoyl-pentapeptide-transferase